MAQGANRSGVNSAGHLGTVVLEAGESIEDLTRKLGWAMAGGRRHRVAVICPRGHEAQLHQRLPEPLRAVDIVASETWWATPWIDTTWVAFLPAGAAFSRPRWDLMPARGELVRPWVPPFVPIIDEGPVIHEPATAWIATTSLLPRLFDEASRDFGLATVVEGLARQRVPVGYVSTPAGVPTTGPPPPGPAATLRRDAGVLAIVPHHRCEPWLEQCLQSLTRQTRPPQAIVVVDDGSPEPPSDIVARFPAVTLLRARANVGPYRILQTIIDGTAFDAYMLQDADDWSTDDRLALQLAEAERTGAELVGAQEIRLGKPEGSASAVCYPLDASRSYRLKLDCQVLHPTTLVSRDLVRRVGGFSSGFRFGADLEFQLRAQHIARIVNIGSFCYFRRRRPGSLWTSPETGLYSEARLGQNGLVIARATKNTEAVARGRPPDLAPLSRAGPVALDHVIGPALRVVDSR